MFVLRMCFLSLLFGMISSVSASDEQSVKVRVAAYNVEFSKSATPEEIGEMFKPYNLDIIGFNEAPDSDWTARVGKVLGMPYSFVGKMSSGNHRSKYKTILSKTPLSGTVEHKLIGGWKGASAVRATTEIGGITIAFYSLHIRQSRATGGNAHDLATKVLPKEPTPRVIVVGDFNNKIGDASMNTLEDSGMRPTWKDLKIDLSKKSTWNALNPKRNAGVIDHIFYNTTSGATTSEGEIIEMEKHLSDHKPVWAEIVFPRKLKKGK